MAVVNVAEEARQDGPLGDPLAIEEKEVVSGEFI
jgi:hypothetical protein